MNEIIKVCKKHGELIEKNCHHKGKSPNGKQYWGCNFCKNINAKKYNHEHKEEIKIKKSEYHQKRKLTDAFKNKKKKWMHDYHSRKRLLYPDKVRENDRRNKLAYSRRNREKLKNEQKYMRDNLRYSYVRRLLIDHFGFQNPSNELIIAKANLLMLKRQIMIMNVNNGKNKYVSKTKRYSRRLPNSYKEKSIIEGTAEDFQKRKSS